MMYQLDRTYGWHGRIYMAGAHDIPDDFAIALGAEPGDSGSQETQEPGGETSTEEVEGTIVPALTLINDAEVVGDITVLPTIGLVGGGTIISNRPAGGYLTFAALQTINAALTQVNWVVVEAWTP